MIPDFKVQNANGNEQVYLQYNNDEKEIYLDQKSEENNLWLLPENIISNYDFYIKLKDEELFGIEHAYRLSEPHHNNLTNKHVVPHNQFDIEDPNSNFLLKGNHVKIDNDNFRLVDLQTFSSINKESI